MTTRADCHTADYHPDFDAIGSGILRRDDRDVIVITADTREGATRQLQQRFRVVMPDVADRIHFLPMQADARYLQLVAAADVVLDPLYYGGAITMYDAFSLGQPVVTLPTPHQRGQYAAAMYRYLGMDIGIAEDANDYIRRAVMIASDADLRRAVRRDILDCSTSLFEDCAVVSAYADAFRLMAGEAMNGKDH